MGNGKKQKPLVREARFAFAHSPFPIPHSQARPRRAKGFSLLEVIAAVLLLGIAFAALMRVAGGAAQLTQKAAQRSEAAMRARSLLDSAFVLEPIRLGASSGKFDKDYRWQMQVSSFNPSGKPVPDAPLRLYQIDVDVQWGVSSRPQRAHFSTLRLVSAPAVGS